VFVASLNDELYLVAFGFIGSDCRLVLVTAIGCFSKGIHTFERYLGKGISDSCRPGMAKTAKMRRLVSNGIVSLS